MNAYRRVQQGADRPETRAGMGPALLNCWRADSRRRQPTGDVTAPTAADDTDAAYFAMTPVL
jgi:hypothetical protein